MEKVKTEGNKNIDMAGTMGKWRLPKSVIIIFILFVPAICGGTEGKGILSLGYANLFRIETLDGGYKKVTDGAGRDLLLVPRGKERLPGYESIPKIEIPLRHVALNSPIYAALLRPIKVLDTVIGVNGNKEYCFIDDIKKGMEDGRIACLGRESSIDYERLKAINPEIFFADNWDKKLIPKLNELHIPVAAVDCFQERHPLGRMEWIKFFAAFYNKEREVEIFLNRAVKRIGDVAAMTAAKKARPKVLSGGMYEGRVYVPCPDSCIAKMITIAGGDYFLKDVKILEDMASYSNITLEEFYVRAKDTDVYVFESGIRDIHSIQELVTGAEILLDIRSIKEGKVWTTLPWYWESIDKIDEVITDLAAVFFPTLFPNHHFGYFRRLPKTEK